MSSPMNRREQRVLDTLVELIAQGIEYPEAEAKATRNYRDMDASRCSELYDEFCRENA